MNTPSPTQREIAAHAGVSQNAVSLALRNSPSIPLSTRRRIQQIAARLGYRPDPLLSALMCQRRARRQNTARAKIAFLHNNPADADRWVSSHYATGCYRGAAETAAKRGYLFASIALDPDQSGKRLTQILWTQNIHGVILAPLPIGTRLELDWSRFSAVSLDYSLSSPALHRVVDDHMAGMARIMNQLVKSGYARPGLIMRGPHDERTNHNRLGAFLALRARTPSIAAVPPLLFEKDAWSERAFGEWLDQHAPDVLITEEREIVSALRDRRLRVPRDLGLVFCYKSDESRRFSGIKVDATRVGAIAARVLIGMIEHNERGIPVSPTTTLVDAASWVSGKSLRTSRR